MVERTPSQTVGPFFHEALRWKDGGRVTFAAGGQRIVLQGTVTDGAGQPVGDAMIETWQVGPQGSAPGRALGAGNPCGLGRVETARDGSFRIETLLPGGDIAAIDVAIFARGLLKALRTRVYLVTEAQARLDPVLQSLASSPRLATLVAQPEGDDRYRWDIRLQGAGETVFFAA